MRPCLTGGHFIVNGIELNCAAIRRTVIGPAHQMAVVTGAFFNQMRVQGQGGHNYCAGDTTFLLLHIIIRSISPLLFIIYLFYNYSLI